MTLITVDREEFLNELDYIGEKIINHRQKVKDKILNKYLGKEYTTGWLFWKTHHILVTQQDVTNYLKYINEYEELWDLTNSIYMFEKTYDLVFELSACIKRYSNFPHIQVSYGDLLIINKFYVWEEEHEK